MSRMQKTGDYAFVIVWWHVLSSLHTCESIDWAEAFLGKIFCSHYLCKSSFRSLASEHITGNIFLPKDKPHKGGVSLGAGSGSFPKTGGDRSGVRSERGGAPDQNCNIPLQWTRDQISLSPLFFWGEIIIIFKRKTSLIHFFLVQKLRPQVLSMIQFHFKKKSAIIFLFHLLKNHFNK